MVRLERIIGYQSVLMIISLLLMGLWGIAASAQTQTGTIMGLKWFDADADGRVPYGTSGEYGLGGWTIYLDLNNNGQLDSGEPSVVTNLDGDYEFTNLAYGTYTVREVLKPGWTQTFPVSGYHTVVINENNLIHRPLDFGNKQDQGWISGIKWEDINGDGKLPSSTSQENGLAGWTIYIDANDNGQLDGGELSVVTDASGTYNFYNLPVGRYVLREVMQNGWRQTAPTSGKHEIHLTSSALIHLGMDFGNQKAEGQGGGSTEIDPSNGSATIQSPQEVPETQDGRVLGAGFEVGGGETLPRTGIAENTFLVLGLMGLGFLVRKNSF